MEMMAVDPVQRILAPRFWAGVIAMPLLAAVFSAVGIIGGWLVGVLLIGVDPGAFWSQMQGGVDVWRDVGNGVIKSIVFGVTVTFVALLQGYRGAADARRRVARHHPHRGGGVAGRARPRFRADGHDVQHLEGATITMQRSKHDVWVGLFVLIGAAALLFLALQVGQPAEPELPADLPGDGALRQHRRPEAAGGGQERRRGGRPGRIDHVRRQDLPGAA